VLRPDCYDAILDEAKKLGMDVVGHIPHDISLAKAIQSGQRTFEHLKGYYSDRTLELTKEDYVTLTRGADVWNCPTLYTHRNGLSSDEIQRLLQTEEARYLSRDERERWLTRAAKGGGENDRKIRELSLVILKELLPTRPKLLTGTDSGGGYPMMVRGFALQQELRLLVEAGLPPAECLRAATLNAAEAMRKENEFGTIKPGQRADLLLIDSDPRGDVTALSKIQGLSVRGIWLDPAALESIREGLRAIFAGDQGLADGETPTPERTDRLLATMTQLESEGAIQMDHNLRELKELLVKSKRSTAPIDALLAARKGK
jgi:imidazolonepropionase-like amidohydrolase